ncbi:uncharacterized protein LOC141817321 [Curcuma longa]|uniref:uncharacterized protein LOC141817321 n=1 Tax=Curcuma longa TaxID=136217 RepID=UPI003D9F9F6A
MVTLEYGILLQIDATVPEVDTALRSLTVMWDGSMVVAANNHGTCYVWRLLKGTQTMTYFEPLHKLQARMKLKSTYRRVRHRKHFKANKVPHFGRMTYLQKYKDLKMKREGVCVVWARFHS